MWKGEEKERDRRMRMNVEGRREGKEDRRMRMNVEGRREGKEDRSEYEWTM